MLILTRYIPTNTILHQWQRFCLRLGKFDGWAVGGGVVLQSRGGGQIGQNHFCTQVRTSLYCCIHVGWYMLVAFITSSLDQHTKTHAGVILGVGVYTRMFVCIYSSCYTNMITTTKFDPLPTVPWAKNQPRKRSNNWKMPKRNWKQHETPS